MSLDRLAELLHEGGAHGWVDEDPWRFPCLALGKILVDANEQLQPSVHAGGRVEVKPTPAEERESSECLPVGFSINTIHTTIDILYKLHTKIAAQD